MSSRPVVAGVDVGAARKGLHAAVLRGTAVTLRRERDADALAAWIASFGPLLVAVDAPIEPGPRACERALARAVCRLFYTPTPDRIADHSFYSWMRSGLGLYAALARHGLRAVECFPTATWTRLAGPRAGRSRARWSLAALASLGLEGRARNQDERDAIGAAYTAQLHAARRTEAFGPIIVPRV